MTILQFIINHFLGVRIEEHIVDEIAQTFHCSHLWGLCWRSWTDWVFCLCSQHLVHILSTSVQIHTLSCDNRLAIKYTLALLRPFLPVLFQLAPN